MSIKKLLLIASAAMTAIAFAAPVAQADVTLTDPTNVQLEPGAEVTVTSINLQTHMVGGNTTTCGKFTLHLEVLTNGPIHVELEQIGTATIENCSVDLAGGGVLPLTFTDWTLTSNLTINTWGHGSVPVTFGWQPFLNGTHTMPAAGVCDYTGNVTFKATTPDKLDVPGSTFTAPGCPNSNLTGEFTLETSDGTPVDIDVAAHTS